MTASRERAELLERLRNPEIELLRRSADGDPYSVFDRLRDRGPIFRSSLGYWLVIGYGECRALLQDARIGALTELTMRPDVQRGRYPTLEEFHRGWLLFSDPPLHTAMRRNLSRCVAGSMRAAMETVVPPLAQEVVEAIDWSQEVDVIERLARPLPVQVLAGILGLPSEDLPRLRRLAVVLSEVLEPFFGARRLERAEDAARQLRNYFSNRTWEGAQPRGGCLQALLSESADEIDRGVANAALLTMSGHETTTSLIGMSIFALLSQPCALSSLSKNSDLMSLAVEELLRYASPVQLVARRATESFDFHGCELVAGDVLLLLLAAANRDPEFFDSGDQLVVDRSPNPHLALGMGSHACFGAALTRSELRAVLHTLLPILDRLEIDPRSVVWQQKRTGRGLEQLVVRPVGGRAGGVVQVR